MPATPFKTQVQSDLLGVLGPTPFRLWACSPHPTRTHHQGSWGLYHRRPQAGCGHEAVKLPVRVVEGDYELGGQKLLRNPKLQALP